MIVVRDLAVTYSAIQVERSAKSNNVPLRDLALGNSARITVRAWKLSISPFRSLKTYDINEAADFLKVDRSTALDLAGNGTLPGAKVGRAWVSMEDELIAYLRDVTRKQTQAHRANAEVSQTIARSQSEPRPHRWRRPLPELPELGGEVATA